MVIEPTGGAQSWLQQSLQGKAVRLTLLSRSGDTAQCIVHTKVSLDSAAVELLSVDVL